MGRHLPTKWPRGTVGACLAASILATASCDDGAGNTTRVDDATPTTAPSVAPASTPVHEPSSSPEPTSEAASPERSAAVPDELIGTWVSTDPGGAELIYVFARDGRYKHAGVLLQQRDTGMFSFQRSAQGYVRVQDGALVLHPESGTQEISDPDVPSANSKRPIDTSPERYDWAVDEDGPRLELTDADGVTIEYARD